MGEDPPLLIADNLHKIHRLGQLRVHALRGASLTVRRGEFVAITGPSGSGKTSLLNLVGLLDEPTQGRILIADVDTARLRGARKGRFRLEKLGFVFQFFNLFHELTALENVALPAVAMGRRRSAYLHNATALLKSLGMAKRLHHYPHQLSGGEQQRVAIARALINDPVLLLTDEPTANIDSVTAERIVEIFGELNRERRLAILMVTHERELAGKAQRVLELKDGVVVKEVRGKA